MPFVEISLPADGPDPDAARSSASQERDRRAPTAPNWADIVVTAAEPCLVLDRQGRLTAASPAARLLLGLPQDDSIIGRELLDGVLNLVDFTPAGDQLSDWELERIAPLVALATGGLARGLLRIKVGDTTRTVDAVASPLWDGDRVTGSFTFLARV